MAKPRTASQDEVIATGRKQWTKAEYKRLAICYYLLAKTPLLEMINQRRYFGTRIIEITPNCPRTELIRGLREHTDAGGIILLLQDDQVPGLEFFNDGKWVKIPPSKNNTMFINVGDQVELLSNGRYKSILHRVLAEKDGNRLSVATFYNPAGDAIISPASKLLYPENYRFEDYLKLYGTTKFREKGERFELMKKIPNAH